MQASLSYQNKYYTDDVCCLQCFIYVTFHAVSFHEHNTHDDNSCRCCVVVVTDRICVGVSVSATNWWRHDHMQRAWWILYGYHGHIESKGTKNRLLKADI